jgi:triosephosphate isomerase (TIM)
MRTPIVAANWKMNTTLAEALALVDEQLPRLQAIERVERVLCPPYPWLLAVRDRLGGTGVLLGAQNVHQEPKGAFTGEVSAPMLADVVEYVIIGHSERRQYFAESDELVNKKLQAALAHGIKPILCVGESLAQNEGGETEQIIERQLRGALAGVSEADSLVIAYEPIWAIGTGRAASGTGANAVAALIRRTVGDLLGTAATSRLRIQYGGSVTADNFAEFISQPEIDGALVGGASLKADSFVEIVRVASSGR